MNHSEFSTIYVLTKKDERRAKSLVWIQTQRQSKAFCPRYH